MDYDELEPLNPIRPEQEQKKWDVFQDPPVQVAVGSTVETKFIDFGERFGKVVSYIVAFIVVLGGAVVSKASLLFMTSQLSGIEKPYCNQGLDRNKQFVVVLPTEEKVAWMWMIMFTFFVPQVGTIMKSIRIMLYKSWKWPSFYQILVVFLSESLSTIGNALLVYIILPRLDVIKGIMLTNAFSFVPAVLMLTSKLYGMFGSSRLDRTTRNSNASDPDIFLKLSLDFLSILIQATVFFVWPLVEDDPILWSIPAAALFISCGWWENFTFDYEKLQKGLLRDITKPNRRFSNSRYFTYVIVAAWKCVLFFMCMIAAEWWMTGEVDHLFDYFTTTFDYRNLTIIEVPPHIFDESINLVDLIPNATEVIIESDYLTPIWLFVISLGSTYLSYAFGKFACKIYIQEFSYSFAINLVVPVTITGIIAICGKYHNDECFFSDIIPPYLFFTAPDMQYMNDFIGQQHSWIWLLWLLSQAWVTWHLWMPKCERLAKTERLFVRPMYEPFVIDQDLAMNRRILDDPPKQGHKQDDLQIMQGLINLQQNRKPRTLVPITDEDTVSRIYACGTMWHETKEEMMEFLKSVVRLDEDQCARRIVKAYLEYPIPDYYELETHVFFDDAFVRRNQDDPDPQMNDYVKDLIEAVDEAASNVHEINIKVRPPVKYLTPYGGRLVWTLPGKTKMIAHLKDKKLIRPKKRWSQVMYMYYLLGHRLMARDDLDERQKTLRSNNTYILALDGDIDFQPKAVRLLVDLMKKDMSLGAACGRIHPIGNGPMVWYQMFEYAIGHWMQKATEHVIGCVLCSPGCFSLFRGSSLMDVGVMRKYATKSSEALHYVQFDQGEDRWLCTLLLQRGYRVEYSAASDAYTHCPEGFNEFFNQRRRWMPSTTANIFDLLLSADKTRKINNNISQLYIFYQLFLMIGTILGPGTIFLMLVGAFVAAFQLDQWSSFMWNVVPILFFVVTCAVFSDDKIQLFVAGVISGLYSLIMMAVLVGVILQINSDGILAPSSLFFFCVAAQMIIAALMHPKEFNCLKYGIVYYVTVPCMYMILVIYSVFNMNNVSWGTREVTVVKQDPNEAPAEVKPEAKPEVKETKVYGSKNDDTAGGIQFALGNIFKCLWFTKQEDNTQLNAILARLDAMEARKEEDRKEEERKEEERERQEQQLLDIQTDHSEESSDTISVVDAAAISTSWFEDESLQRGMVGMLSGEEVEFWNGILDKYLAPVDESKDKARIAENLKALRNKVVLAFFMINAMFVLIVFLLTLKKEFINVKWPFSVKANFTYIEDSNEVRIYKEYLELEPIGFVFLILFASLLLIQFGAMLIHRLQTFMQIVANTVLNFNLFDRQADNLTEEEIVKMDPVKFVKKLQKLKGVDDSDDEDDEMMNAPPARRQTIFRLQKSAQRQKQGTNDLEEAFRRRTAVAQDYRGPLPRKTVDAIVRRKTIVENRKSVAFNQHPFVLNQGQANSGYVHDEADA